jgi:hypothetical protein
MADITITEIGTDNTLLLDAINKGKARFVSDCASYLQVSARASAWNSVPPALAPQPSVTQLVTPLGLLQARLALP